MSQSHGGAPYGASTGGAAGTAAQAAASILAGANTFTAGQSFAEVDKGPVASGTVAFSCAAGNCQKLTVAGPLTISLGNWPAAGTYGDILIELVNGGSAVVALPTAKWELPSANAPLNSITEFLTAIGRSPAALKAAGTDYLYFWSTDGGTTIHAKVL